MLRFKIIGLVVPEKKMFKLHQEAPHALIGQAVSVMFENNSHVHVYSPGAGTDSPLGSMLFFSSKNITLLLICSFVASFTL